MSKGNMLLGFARGKVGDIVFARRLGEQTTRAYVSRVNDAATRAQVEQRSRLGNIVASYRAYKTLLQRAFESKSIGQTDYNAFAGANLATSQVYLTQEQTAAGACVVAPYMVSRGSLPTIQIIEKTSGLFFTNIAVPDGFAIDDTTTIAQLSAAIITANADWHVGEQLTIVQAEQWIQVNTGYPMASVRLYEVILDYNNTEIVRGSIPDNVLTVTDGFLVTNNAAFIGAITVIHSQLQKNETLRVSSQIMLLTNSNNVYAQYSGPAAQEIAVETRGYKQGVYLDPNTNAGSSASGVVIPGSPSVGTISLAGRNLLTETTSQELKTDDLMNITGANLTPADITLSYWDGSSKTIADALTITINTDTNIAGTVKNSENGKDLKNIIVGGVILRSYPEPAPYIDPNT